MATQNNVGPDKKTKKTKKMENIHQSAEEDEEHEAPTLQKPSEETETFDLSKMNMDFLPKQKQSGKWKGTKAKKAQHMQKEKKARYYEDTEDQTTPSEPPKSQENTEHHNAESPNPVDVEQQKGAISKKPKKEVMRYDPYPGSAPVPQETVKKYTRGEKMNSEGIRTNFHQHQYKRKEKRWKMASKEAARAEFLLPEEAGFIEAEENVETSTLTQHDIAANVDIMSAQKFFDLKLDKFGPYRANYTRNGRQLLIGGAKGHVAAMDWQTKKLMCEINVMETVQDVKWLHIETMFAVAQRQWTYIYDNQGIELHCLKTLNETLRLEFLPYHFLLVAGNARGYLSYIDVSIGQKVVAFPTSLGRLDVMCQNPRNAIIHLGHSGGTVTMWSPNVKTPLVKMLCHGSGTRSIAVNQTGDYMATSGIDRTLKIWDLRTYKMLQSYKVGAGASHLSFSQQGTVAAGIGNIVEIYKDCITTPATSVYLNHRCPGTVANLQFCPYEDVLGVGHAKGFTSLLVPGSGEANFDALEANPYQTKKQRQQAEVKMLLEKVQPDMISLDTSALGKVDVKTLQDQMEEKKKILWVKDQKIDFDPKYKKKGKSKAGKIEKRKQGVRFEHKRQQIKDLASKTVVAIQEEKQKEKSEAYNVFSRFKKSST